jgi:hypothetical protein
MINERAHEHPLSVFHLLIIILHRSLVSLALNFHSRVYNVAVLPCVCSGSRTIIVLRRLVRRVESVAVEETSVYTPKYDLVMYLDFVAS